MIEAALRLVLRPCQSKAPEITPAASPASPTDIQDIGEIGLRLGDCWAPVMRLVEESCSARVAVADIVRVTVTSTVLVPV